MSQRGFTLIELMIAVSIIGILAAIASPQFGKLIIKSRHATTLGNLAALRVAITLFTIETGRAPVDNLASVIAAGHINRIPVKDTTPYHDAGRRVSAGRASDMPASTGDWFYFNAEDEPAFGLIIVNCVHSDLKGRVWSSM